jgi:hypothetical protein
MESKNIEIYLNDYLINATKPDAEDELIIIDSSFIVGKNILDTYINDNPSKSYN